MVRVRRFVGEGVLAMSLLLAALQNAGAANACDLNGSGSLNINDIQISINQAVGAAPCTNADLNKDGTCNVIDVQLLVNGVLSGVCPVTTSGGTPQFGTASSGMNLPISFWGVGWDSAATADLQQALSVNSYSSLYWTIGDDSFATYYVTSADPEYPLADASGKSVGCPGGGGVNYTTVRLPSYITSSWNGLYTVNNDQHLSVVDSERNRVYAFYSYQGQTLGLVNGVFESGWRACDYLKNPNGDAPVAAAVANRSQCTAYPCSGTTGIGLGASVSSDRNGYMSPYGDIMPQDFDDTGWSGDAVGTLHHALYTIIPTGYISKAVWPTPNEGNNTRSLHNGSIIQLDPHACSATAYDASCFTANDRRIAKTLMVYGAVILDFGSYGPKFSGQFTGKDSNGNQHFTNPWTPAGTPGLSQAAYNEISSATNNGAAGVIYLNSISSQKARLHALAAHGAVY